jgi:4-amino-4-deoxy-L-arabinose transferase-like glycosyltransferase
MGRNYFRWIGTVTVLGIVLAAVIWNIAVEPLDHGYPRFAAIAEAMVRTGDWIVPRLDDEIYMQKPPLFIWLVAIPIALMDRIPEWAGHLPNILAALGKLFGVYLFSRRIFGFKENALLSILILATSYDFTQHTRDERLDMVFTVFLVGAFLCFYQAVTSVPPGRGRIIRIVACYTFVALAALTKGPVGLLFFLAVVIPFALWTGKGRFFLEKECLLGYGIFLVISSIWPLLVIEKIGLKESLSAFQSTEIMTRREGPFYYLIELPIIFSPWSIFLPAVVIWLVREKPYRESTGIRFLLCWFAAFFLLLHLSSTKSTRYLFPATPPLALLTAGFFYSTIPGTIPSASKWITRVRDGMLWILLGSLLAASFASPFLLSRVKGEAFFIIAGSLVAGIGSLVLLWQFFKYREIVKTLFAFGILLLLLYAIFDAVQAREFMRGDGRILAEQALAPITAGAPARTYGLRNTQRQFLVSMLTRRSVPGVATLPELKAWIRDERGVVFVVADAQHAKEILTDPELSAESCATFCLERHDITMVRVAAGKRSVGIRYE